MWNLTEWVGSLIDLLIDCFVRLLAQKISLKNPKNESAILSIYGLYHMLIWKVTRAKFVFPFIVPPILDMGCGDGANVLNWLKNPDNFVGCDINKKSLKEYKRKGGNPVKADIRYLPFITQKLGTILAFHCLEHISHKDGLLVLDKLSRHSNVFIEVPRFPLLVFGAKEAGHDPTQRVFRGKDFEKYGFHQCYNFSPQSVLLMTNVGKYRPTSEVSKLVKRRNM